MSRTNSSKASAVSSTFSGKRIAGALLTALSLGVMGSGVANALPGATNIYPGECPPGGSAAVRCVQWVMNDYAGHPLDQDGCYLSLSQAAVKDLQRFFSLDADAIVGPDTGSALDTVMYFNSSDPDWDRWNATCFALIPTHP